MLIIFQKEGCPFSSKVRQFMTDKEIDYVLVNAPNGAASRKIMEGLGGKAQVPFLIDLDRGEWLYESDDIINYVKENYLS